MRMDADRLNLLARECVEMLPAALLQGASKDRSARTETEYQQMVYALEQRAQAHPGGLVAVVQDTGSPRTFHKRVAALKFCCRYLVAKCLDARSTAQDLDWPSLADALPRLHAQLNALATLNQQGMTQPRRKRRSKREALKGLPQTWREELCECGAAGKYADALLVSALTGARPGEVVKGITAWLQYDDELGTEALCLHMHGLKVKAQQGQPNRFIAYAAGDEHPLVVVLVKRLRTLSARKLHIEIAKAGNFTKEIERLGRKLWRHHPYPITATCFRHQWSADVKAAGDPDAASRGLGHRSPKTRKCYGTAHQAHGRQALRPVRIEADLPVKGPASVPQAVTQQSGRNEVAHS